jgi:hypothetical protein
LRVGWHFFFMWVFIVRRPRIRGLVDRDPARLARSGATRTDLGSILAVDQGSCTVPPPARRSREALQRALQKLTYLSVIFVWLPLVILMGFAMSPSLNALLPGWVDLFGGTPIGPHAALRRGARARRIHCAARVSGDHDRTVEQHALDAERTLSL